LRRAIAAIDSWQSRRPLVGCACAVVRKSGDDDAGILAVALAWYGFTAIYPLLLAVTTVLGYIGVGSLGKTIVDTLHQFPVIGTDFTPGRGGSDLHGNAIGLAIGVAGLVYGAQGVTQTAQTTMARIWGAPRDRRPGFGARLLRSVAGLSTIGVTFLANAALAFVVTGNGRHVATRIVLVVAMLALDVGGYLVAFLVLTPPSTATLRQQLPGAMLAGVGFTLLTTLGSGLMEHQLRNASNTYGAFASVIGVVGYLLLLAELTVYASELNVVLARRLWPRSLLERER